MSKNYSFCSLSIFTTIPDTQKPKTERKDHTEHSAERGKNGGNVVSATAMHCLSMTTTTATTASTTIRLAPSSAVDDDENDGSRRHGVDNHTIGIASETLTREQDVPGLARVFKTFSEPALPAKSLQ